MIQSAIIIGSYPNGKNRIKTTINEMKNYINNWKFNRPPDRNRINNIKNYIMKNNQYCLDGTICLWDNDGYYYIYDGIHRYSAGLQLIEEKKLNDIDVYVEIYKTDDEENIKNEFQKLNKSIPVDQIYMNMETDLDIKNKIEEVCDRICNQYKKYLVVTNNPRNGNFNRTILKNWLYDINIKDHTVDTICSKILAYNEYLFKKFKDVHYNLLLQKKFKDRPLFIFLKSNQYEFKLHMNNALSYTLPPGTIV
jgi:hypothetical protein